MDNSPQVDEETARNAALWWTSLRDRQPSVDVLDRWQAWMTSDPRHARAFAELNTIAELAAAGSPAQRQQLIDEFAPRAAPRQRTRFVVAAATAAVVLLAVMGWWRHGGEPGSRPSAQQYVSTVGENRAIRLADGTAVDLGAASSLTSHYARDRRELVLAAGEAFFTVTHDASRPFVVAAGPLQIQDLGTAFNVRRTGERVSVSVTQGRVRLTRAAGAAGHSDTSGRLDLVAGQRAEFDPRSGAVSVSQVSAEHATAWRDNRLEFVNEPLADVIANVNRYTRHPVQFADARLGQLKFTGTVNIATIDSWVGALPHVFPVQVSSFADHVVLSSIDHQ